MKKFIYYNSMSKCITRQIKSLIKNNKIKREFLVFLIAGISANIMSFLIYVLFYKYNKTPAGLSSVFGQCSALLISYLINSRIGFRRKANLFGKLSYLIYHSSIISIVGVSIQMLTNIGFEYRLSWLISVSTIAISNFVFLKRFVFKT